MAKKKLTFSQAATYLIYALVIIFAFLALFGKFSFGGIRLLTVRSGSMAPQIKIGSLVLVKKETSYQVGDIITFQNTNQKESTTHRIVQIDQEAGVNLYTTQGDANNGPDNDPVAERAILGKIVLSLPLLGYIVAFSRTWPGVIVLIIIPATIIIYDEINNLKKEWVKRKPRKKEK